MAMKLSKSRKGEKLMKRTDYYTPPEAASVMMCSALHVRMLIRKQKPVYQVGKRSYIPKAAVEEYIASKTIAAKSSTAQEACTNGKPD